MLFNRLNLLLIFVAAHFSCVHSLKSTQQRVKHVVPSMGVVFKAAWIKSQHDQKMMDAIDFALQSFESQLNHYDPNSNLWHLTITNAWQSVSDLTYDVFKKAKHYHDLSSGHLNHAIYPLMNLWKFYDQRIGDLLAKPNTHDIQNALKCLDVNAIEFDDDQKLMKFNQPCMKFDFGYMAKGYVLDQVIQQAKALNIMDLQLDFGQQVYSQNLTSHGIRDLIKSNESLVSVLLKDASISTTSFYGRMIKVKSAMYAHIIHPKTGRPISDVKSISVIAKSASDADAYSTWFYLLDEEQLQKKIKQIKNVAAIVLKVENDRTKVNVYMGDKKFMKKHKIKVSNLYAQ